MSQSDREITKFICRVMQDFRSIELASYSFDLMLIPSKYTKSKSNTLVFVDGINIITIDHENDFKIALEFIKDNTNGKREYEKAVNFITVAYEDKDNVSYRKVQERLQINTIKIRKLIEKNIK